MATADVFEYYIGVPYQDLGAEYRYTCPFCESDKKKFYAHVQEDSKEGQWVCFNCSKRGNLTSFIMQMEDLSYADAQTYLEDNFQVASLDLEEYDDELTDEEKMLLFMDDQKHQQVAEEHPQEVLKPSPFLYGYKPLWPNRMLPEAQPFLNYCHYRGFADWQIQLHQIGYVRKGYALRPNGSKVYLHDHIVFLTFNDQGQYIYWNTRATYQTTTKAFNAPEFDGCYSKRTVMFNWNLARSLPEIVVTEGVPDALTLGPAGVGTFGKNVTDEQVDMLASVAPEQRIYIMLDMDALGPINKLAQKLYPRHSETYLVINHTLSDANELGYQKAWEIIHSSSVKADETGRIRLMIGE